MEKDVDEERPFKRDANQAVNGKDALLQTSDCTSPMVMPYHKALNIIFGRRQGLGIGFDGSNG